MCLLKMFNHFIAIGTCSYCTDASIKICIVKYFSQIIDIIKKFDKQRTHFRFCLFFLCSAKVVI